MNDIYTSRAGGELITRRYRDALADWQTPNEHRLVPTSQGETFVLVSGRPEAPPVLLLHGSSANSSRWLGEATAWAEGFRLYAVDLIGEPGLSAPSRPPLDSPEYGQWLDEVLDALGLGTVAIVAESLGGWLAVHYASTRPERVTRLALLCPGGIGKQKLAMLPLALMLRTFGDWGVRRSMAMLCGTADLPEFALTILRHYRPRVERLPIADDDALRRLTMPLLVVLGARDRMLDSAGTRRRLAGTAPHVQLVELPEAGHLLPPQTDTVHAFLNGA